MVSSNRKNAEIIKKIIAFLKGQKISQQEIESRLNYTSLSKAKNYEKYPQVIIEKKTREELLESLCEEFSLLYEEATDSIQFIQGADKKQSLIDIEYYIMHYYAFAREETERAMVQIINKRKVIIDYAIDDEHWEGLFSVIENYSFIELTKMGYTTPVKKLLCLFSGTMKYGLPILLGTYSTVKRDGYPAAGKVVLEKAIDKANALSMINRESDHRIRGFLRNNVHVTRTYTPATIADLSFNHSDEYLKVVGDYRLLIPSITDEWIVASITINKDYSADLNVNNLHYKGSISSYNADSLSIRFRKKKVIPSEPTAHLLKIEINTRGKTFSSILQCAGCSPTLHINPSSFLCYCIPENKFEGVDRELFEKRLNIAS